tara:strand:+ start:862 stop:1377 length:516 start_codon:yes stop_codon:yes gene_type:complete
MIPFLCFLLILCILGCIILYKRVAGSELVHHNLIRENQQLFDNNKELNAAALEAQQNQLHHDKELQLQISSLEKQLTDSEGTRRTTLSQKKSSEVRLGHIAETLAPFLDQFDFDPENCTFLGKPIDYISFDDDAVTLIEIKSGNSQLSSKQRHIRDLVKNNQVNWKEIRIK